MWHDMLSGRIDMWNNSDQGACQMREWHLILLSHVKCGIWFQFLYYVVEWNPQSWPKFYRKNRFDILVRVCFWGCHMLNYHISLSKKFEIPIFWKPRLEMWNHWCQNDFAKSFLAPYNVKKSKVEMALHWLAGCHFAQIQTIELKWISIFYFM